MTGTRLALCLAAWLPAEAALAYINPRFTPVHLVTQSETIGAGALAGTPEAGTARLCITELLKGKLERDLVLNLAAPKQDRTEEGVQDSQNSCREKSAEKSPHHDPIEHVGCDHNGGREHQPSYQKSLHLCPSFR